ncbi:MAG: cache domain-containing protein, partial [Spirochaetes bacterium]|nr:cache domain-containing protein [Spirochaetota bacterium]
MDGLDQKTRKRITRYMQILFVLLAFTLMVIVSYWFVSDIERKHLQRDVKNAILNTESKINADMLEPETALASIAETIRSMILRGYNVETLQKYIVSMNSYVKSSVEKRLLGAFGFYGFFDVFGGVFIAGDPAWFRPEGYVPQERPWYQTAIDADGDIGVTQPYFSLISREVTITFARRIFDEDGKALGIVCLDMKLDRIKQLAVDTQFAEKGYGFLLSKNMDLIAHPEPSMIGMAFHDVNSSIASYEDELIHKGHVYEVITTDYRNIECIVFLERLQNGWYMGV